LCDYRRYKEVKRAILDGVERFPNYVDWLRQDVGKSSNGGLAYDLDVKVHNLSIPPSFIGRSYKSMVTYENHFRATAWPTTSSMVT
jgi:hypothetical protein